MEDQKLTYEENRSIVLESCLQFIPVVGGPASTAIFGRRLEKRLARIEAFMHSVRQQILDSSLEVPPKTEVELRKLEVLTESITDKIEKEAQSDKVDLFKKYLINTITAKEIDFDLSKSFLDSLHQLSLADVKMLIFINAQSTVVAGQIKCPGVGQYAILGSINLLRQKGFIKAASGDVTIGDSVDNALTEVLSISDHGKEFINYCVI